MNLKTLLETVFNTKPADYRSNYIPSYTNDRRYKLSNQGKLEEVKITKLHSTPDWLNSSKIGEFERYMLHEILNSRNYITAYRSGTGSGKTSIVKAIRNFCQDTIENSKTITNKNFKNFVCDVDLEDANKFSYDGLKNQEITTDLVDEFYSYLSRKLLFELNEISLNNTPHYILKEILDKNNPNPYQNLPEITSLDSFFQYKKYDFFESNKQDSKIILNEYLGTLNGYEAFELMYYIFLFIGTDFSIKNNGHSFVLIFDNSDGITKEILDRFLIKLVQLTNKHEDYNSQLKICIFTRFSTSRDAINAFPIGYSDYLAPDPIDILINRGISFIVRDDNNYTEYKPELLEKCDYIICELILNIIDHNQQFKTTLISLSGTNIRNMFKQTIKWCISNDIKPRINNRNNLQKAKEILVRNHFFKFLSESIDCALNTITLPSKATEYNDQWLINNIDKMANSINSTFLGVREQHIIGENPKKIMLQDYAIRQEIQKVLIKEKYAVENIYNIEPIKSIIKIHRLRIDRYLIREVFKKSEKRTIFKKLLNFTPDLIDRICEKYQNSAEAIRLCLLIVNEEVSSSNDSEPLYAKQRAFNVKQNEIKKLLTTERKQSRFDQSIVLLKASQDNDFPALNVFSLNKVEYSSCMLYILYFLVEQMDNRPYMQDNITTLSQVKEMFKVSGFSNRDLITSLSILTQSDSRLVYSFVNDSDKFKENLTEDYMAAGVSLNLSWTGYNYIKYLIPSTLYTEFVFANTLDLMNQFPNQSLLNTKSGISFLNDEYRFTPRAEILVNNIENYIRGWSFIIHEEILRVKELSAQFINKFKCYSPVFELFFSLIKEVIQIVMLRKSNRQPPVKNTLVTSLSLLFSIANEVLVFIYNKNRIKHNEWHLVVDNSIKLCEANGYDLDRVEQ